MLQKDLAPHLQKLAPIIGKFFPKYKTLGLDGEHVSKDRSVVNAYRKDPLIYHGKSNARSGWEVMKAMKRLQEKAAEFDLPISIMHGMEDKLTEPEGSIRFFENISSKDKELKLYDGLYHEIFNEPEQEIFYADLEKWMSKKLDF